MIRRRMALIDNFWTHDPRPPEVRPAIGICGSYGGLNVGDEAILTVALVQLRNTVPDVELTVFTRDVAHTRAHHRVEHVIDARCALRDELAAEVERLDLLLVGGGGILYDRESAHYLHLPRIAQALGVPTATYAIGAGPLERDDERRAVAEVLNRMARITVRDGRARRLLEEIGVEREVTVTADPAVLLDPAPPPPHALEREGVPRDRHLVGVSVREPGGAAAGLEDGAYHRLLADAADFVAARFDANLLFVPMERQDVRHAHRVIAEMGMPDRASVLKAALGPRELLGIMAELDFAIGMRLHFVIFAALAGVPAVALPYASKVTSVLERLGLPTPAPVERDHAGPLLATIDRTWDLRHDYGAMIAPRLAELREEARRTPALIASLLPAARARATAGQA
jgi:polysaccharide pyruvyl transferase CsaB